MKCSIGQTISRAIKECKWVSIDYINKEGQESSFWCAITDVDVQSKYLTAEIFNIFKGDQVLNTYLFFESIKSATIIEGTYYERDPHLIEKIEMNISKAEWLEYDNFSDKILEYYSMVKKYDTDPYQSQYSKVQGIDTNYLLRNRCVDLSDEQFKIIAEDIYHNEDVEKTNKFSQLAINKLAISDKGREYIIAHYPLKLDVVKRQLVIRNELIINKSFLVGETRLSLSSYLTMNPDDFTNLLQSNYEEARELLRENLRSTEKIEENPLIMLISRNISMEYDAVFEVISEKHKEGSLEKPLKAFFGELSLRREARKEPNIVLMDKKADIDQIRVVYNAMKRPVTYVQGPPGTGKTTTLVNVVLSSFLNDETCLICSNNNKPIDDIVKRFDFECRYGKILFPIIRLGNRDELQKALNKIGELLEIDAQKIKIYDDMLKELAAKTSGDYTNLKMLLEMYETRMQVLESKKSLDKYFEYVMSNANSSPRLKNKIQQQKSMVENKLSGLRDVTNEEVLANCKFVKDDQNFLMYLYFNSFKYIKKLNQPSYGDLRDIIKMEDPDSRVTTFIKWLKDEANFKKFQKVFPVIVCTNISCFKLGANEPYFDICIMDEAGQCDVATSIVPLSKCKRLLLVGDVNQLQPVITLDSILNDKLMDRYEVPSEYDYCHNSIMNLLTKIDTISPQILLRYHYRCGKKIADYSNRRYYDGQLNIKTALEENQLEYIKVQNNFFGAERNSYQAEAQAIVDYITVNKLNENSVTIITPFRNQASLINEELAKKNIKVKCGTIHTVQGAENDIVIFSPAVGIKTSKKTYEWLANNKELINVAVTRAKKKLVFVADDQALKALSNKDVEDDIIALSNYVQANGTITVSKSTVNKIEIGLSNDSQSEKELFDTMTHFCSVYSMFTAKRNQPVHKVLNGVSENEVSSYFYNSEFDLVLYCKNEYGKSVPKLVIELNGGEHYISKSKSAINDKKKMDICKKYGLQYISIPNSYSKSYETIANLIFTLSGEKDEQFDLFDLLKFEY